MTTPYVIDLAHDPGPKPALARGPGEPGDRLAGLIYYVGQHQLNAGLVALAAILWSSDSAAYCELGAPITDARYVKAERPGRSLARGGVVRAFLDGCRWGAIEHRLRLGRVTVKDARWVAERWREGVPL